MKNNSDSQITVLSLFFLILTLAIIVRLFVLQILQHDYYSTFALSTHEIYKKIHPVRGAVYFQDVRNGFEYPAAINRHYHLLYVVPKEIKEDQRENVVNKLTEFLKFNDEEKIKLMEKVSKPDDPYEPVGKKIEDEPANLIKEEKLVGVYLVQQEYRYYPENNLGASVVGFLGMNADGEQQGKYGVEGYWEEALSGKGGFVSGERGALGSWITMADRNMEPAENGVDIVLTIDRALEYKACERLREGMKEYKAKSASLVMMNPETGAILAMCSLPDFNPNEYSKVEDISAYNNSSIFTAYEPGSVFKPITMAIALDLDLVTPNTIFHDPCKMEIDGHTIHNAMKKCHDTQTMTGVLEKSINTGMIWVQDKIGNDRFLNYVKKFGFGEKVGVHLDTESSGDISSLSRKSRIYGANGSFGQGLTVTPLQLAVAYSALANNGWMPKPHIIREIRYANGKIERTEEKILGNVISPRASKLITGMLVSVIENQYKDKAGVSGYYLAGKTGTAQIPGPGGYSEDTNHTFVGYGPSDGAKVVLVVKYEKPEVLWAESTSAPVFRDIMKFALEYLGIEKTKK